MHQVQTNWPGAGVVDVWTASVMEALNESDALAKLLSMAETERVRRHLTMDGRRRFVVGRGLLRRLLGYYLGMKPADIELSYGAHGKPEIPGCSLQFNLSHAGDTVVLVFARDRAVGVDVERIVPEMDVLALAGNVLAKAEQEALAGCDGKERVDAFFRCWTRKEALLKAAGCGLLVPPADFTVPVGAGGPEPIDSVGSSSGNGRWLLMDLDVGAGYAAALVVEGVAELEIRWRPARGRATTGKFAMEGAGATIPRRLPSEHWKDGAPMPMSAGGYRERQ